MSRYRIPELLAPVGGWKQLLAAVNNGADAVYMGGSFFNARMKAEKFSSSEMKKAIDYAHGRRVKVYITLNTLIKDSELSKAFAYACELYDMGADGLIIQDMGLARLIKLYLPGMPMHLSTQGTVYNSGGVELAGEIGFCRLVPARELSIVEIKNLAEESHRRGMELEVFIHGAMCICYSGQCQMSRLIAGSNSGKSIAYENPRSGNRGLCAQPCRLMYSNDRNKAAYWLSPKDMCTLKDIPALCSAGVDSLKIEGRLKSPEYVATVTRIYRKYLDIYGEMGRFDLDEKDMRELLRIFNRGGFSEGYLYENPGNRLLSGKSPKNTGIYLGKILSVSKAAGKGRKEGRLLAELDLGDESVSLGDGVETDRSSNIVTYLERLKNGRVRIGDFKGEIRPGDIVYKVSDRKLLDRAAETFSAVDEQSLDRLLHRKTELRMRLSCIEGEAPVLELAEKTQTTEDGLLSREGAPVKVKGDELLEKALKRPADPERLKETLCKLGGTPFIASKEDIELEIRGEAMVPVRVINQLRRDGIKELLDKRIKINRETTAAGLLEHVTKEEKLAEKAKSIERNLRGRFEMSSAEDSEKASSDSTERFYRNSHLNRKLVPLELFMEGGKRDRNTVPYILNISRGNLDRYLENNFEAVTDAVKDCGIMVGNLGWIKRFRDSGIKVFGDYGLNIYNLQALKLFREMGVEPVFWSDEKSVDGKHTAIGLPFRDEIGWIRSPELMERVPLMITEHPLRSRYLVDRKGVKHTILKWYSDDKYLIF